MLEGFKLGFRVWGLGYFKFLVSEVRNKKRECNGRKSGNIKRINQPEAVMTVCIQPFHDLTSVTTYSGSEPPPEKVLKLSETRPNGALIRMHLNY